MDVLDADDIAATVRFCRCSRHDRRVFATGHGGTGLGARSILFADRVALDTCVVDAAQRTARSGRGGVAPSSTPPPLGSSPLCGSSPTVGVIGYLSGGDRAPVSTFGSSVDHARALTVVTGDGRCGPPRPQENPELFWGLRGGKATLASSPRPSSACPRSATSTAAQSVSTVPDAAVVIRAWRDWAALLPDEASTSVALLNLPQLPTVPPMLAGRLSVAVRYASVADAGGCRRGVRADPRRRDTTARRGGCDAVCRDRCHPRRPAWPMPVRERGGLFTALSDAAVDILVDAVTRRWVSCCPSSIRALGGRMAKEPAVRSALCHRDAPFNLEHRGAPRR